MEVSQHVYARYLGSISPLAGAVGEGKFVAPIDVTVSHTDDNVTVGFGSTVGGNRGAELKRDCSSKTWADTRR